MTKKENLKSPKSDYPKHPKTHEHALVEIFTQLRVRTGHDFMNYKRATVLRRIDRRISLLDLPDLPAYAQYLRDNPEEAQALLKDLLISVTNFFRDCESFQRSNGESSANFLRAKDRMNK